MGQLLRVCVSQNVEKSNTDPGAALGFYDGGGGEGTLGALPPLPFLSRFPLPPLSYLLSLSLPQFSV